jgi:hypothetical protein
MSLKDNAPLILRGQSFFERWPAALKKTAATAEKYKM